jgi:hypothetical protein
VGGAKVDGFGSESVVAASASVVVGASHTDFMARRNQQLVVHSRRLHGDPEMHHLHAHTSAGGSGAVQTSANP